MGRETFRDKRVKRDFLSVLIKAPCPQISNPCPQCGSCWAMRLMGSLFPHIHLLTEAPLPLSPLLLKLLPGRLLPLLTSWIEPAFAVLFVRTGPESLFFKEKEGGVWAPNVLILQSSVVQTLQEPTGRQAFLLSMLFSHTPSSQITYLLLDYRLLHLLCRQVRLLSSHSHSRGWPHHSTLYALESLWGPCSVSPR